MGDKDCPNAAKVLVSSIAQASHSPDAQAVLVQEIKSALLRALALPESSDKHVRVQAVTSLINTVIEAVVSTNRWSMHKCEVAGADNNIIKLLVRKGIVSDLARVPHSLDLASPNMAATVNAALHPLETLSRIVNQPQPQSFFTTKKSKTSDANPTSSAPPFLSCLLRSDDIYVIHVVVVDCRKRNRNDATRCSHH